MKKLLLNIQPKANALLNSYSVLFFSNNRWLGLLLLLVSFFNPHAGLSGFIAVVGALVFSKLTGLSNFFIQKGIYSYNALLVGIGMGTFYEWGIAFWVLFCLSVLLSVVLSALMHNRMVKLGLPFLSVPFVLCFWLILLVSKEFAALDFSTHNIYWLNEMYAIGDEHLVKFVLFMENLNLPPLVNTFFKALSSLFFQNNILAGMLIALGVLLHSRIVFSLLVIGFLSAYGFNYLVKAYDTGINYYLLGVNFMMVSVAIGSFFVIPSIFSYLWAIVSVPITFLSVIALGKIMGIWLLPVYSIPFCLTVFALLYFFMLKEKKESLVLTPVQLYSPEKNLYNYLNSKERKVYNKYVRIKLPFLGQWLVSQGYDGNITHKGDWSKALDFIIVDNEMKTYNQYAFKPEHFYCYNKPVLAPANGWVQEILDYVEDNEIGKINKEQNWGNSIVIKHGEHLYTKISHLRKFSFKVKVGDYVKQGDIIATCGNSGRSPEPHIHFQVQATPYIGSKTMAYPIAAYASTKNGITTVHEFKVPGETELVKNIEISHNLEQAFEFLPGFRLMVQADGFTEGDWEVFTDEFNRSYIYCHNEKAFAYFERNDTFFYFTAFNGSMESLLYQFYLSAYKIILSTDISTTTTDKFPLQWSKNGLYKFVQDLVAPFYIFSRLLFESKNTVNSGDIFNTSVTISSKQTEQFFQSKKVISESKIEIVDNKVAAFTILIKNQLITAKCITQKP